MQYSKLYATTVLKIGIFVFVSVGACCCTYIMLTAMKCVKHHGQLYKFTAVLNILFCTQMKYVFFRYL